MRPLTFFLAILAVLLSLTTCTARACPLLDDTKPATLRLANGDSYPLPGYSGPSGSLFPQAVPEAIVQSGSVTVPLPTFSGIGQILQLFLSGVIAYFLRRQSKVMETPED